MGRTWKGDYRPIALFWVIAVLSPDWSAVNNTIIYMSVDTSPRVRIHFLIIDPEANWVRDLGDNLYASAPRWSADGKQFIYVNAFGEGFIILNADGSPSNPNHFSDRISNTVPGDRFPIWQP